jgi:uncharacterized membrane protein YgcG
MKLTKVHLLLILLLSLILASSLGNYIRDGFTTTQPTSLPDALKPVATKDLASNTKLPSNTKYDPSINGGVSASSLGAPVSALSPSTFPMNTPGGIPGMNSVSGNDQANAGGGGSGGGGSSEHKCPPCPACARCPEPAFECKKVPNYSRSEDMNAPRPVMADFSQFGM